MASPLGRGAQVRLEGEAQARARGVIGTALADNMATKDALERAGVIADGSTADGSTRSGVAAEDEVLAPSGYVEGIAVGAATTAVQQQVPPAVAQAVNTQVPPLVTGAISGLNLAGVLVETSATTDPFLRLRIRDANGQVLAELRDPEPQDEAPPADLADWSIEGTAGLRRWRSLRGRFRARAEPKPRASIVMLGDSWEYGSRVQYTGALTQALMDAYGDGGPGWIGVQNRNSIANPVDSPCAHPDITVTRVGSGWTNDSFPFFAEPTPNLGAAIFPNASDYFEIACTPSGYTTARNTGVPPLEGMRAGVVTSGAEQRLRYQWGDGAWGEVAFSGPAGRFAFVTIPGAPATSAWRLRVGATAAGVKLGGLLPTYTGPGIVVHKCAVSGSSAAHFASVMGDTANGLAAAFAALDVDLYHVHLSANDRRANPAIGVYARQIREVAQFLEAANPRKRRPDFMFTCAPDFIDYARFLDNPMDAYAHAMRLAAREVYGCSIRLQAYYGPGNRIRDYIPRHFFPTDQADELTVGSAGIVDASTVYVTGDFTAPQFAGEPFFAPGVQVRVRTRAAGGTVTVESWATAATAAYDAGTNRTTVALVGLTQPFAANLLAIALSAEFGGFYADNLHNDAPSGFGLMTQVLWDALHDA